MTHDKENAALQVASLKKELEAKKKEVIKLTGERDALKEAAKQKKTGSGASAKEVKELADLRQQVLHGSARETVLREQLESLSNRMIERGSAGASHVSVSSTANAVALAGDMKPDYTGLASLLTAASPAVASTYDCLSVFYSGSYPSALPASPQLGPAARGNSCRRRACNLTHGCKAIDFDSMNSHRLWSGASEGSCGTFRLEQFLEFGAFTLVQQDKFIAALSARCLEHSGSHEFLLHHEPANGAESKICLIWLANDYEFSSFFKS
jgi:hypothetical protein